MNPRGGAAADHHHDGGAGHRGPSRARSAPPGRSSRSRLDRRVGRHVRDDERAGLGENIHQLLGHHAAEGSPLLAAAEAAEEVVPGGLEGRRRGQPRRGCVAEGFGQFEHAVVARGDAVPDVLVGVEGEVGQQGRPTVRPMVASPWATVDAPAPAGPVTAMSWPSVGAIGGAGSRRGVDGVGAELGCSAPWRGLGHRSRRRGRRRARGDRELPSRPGPSTTARAGAGPTDGVGQYPVDTRQSGLDDRQVDRGGGDQCSQLLGGDAGGGLEGKGRARAPPGDGPRPGRSRATERGTRWRIMTPSPFGDRTSVSWPSSTASTSPTTSDCARRRTVSTSRPVSVRSPSVSARVSMTTAPPATRRVPPLGKVADQVDRLAGLGRCRRAPGPESWRTRRRRRTGAMCPGGRIWLSRTGSPGARGARGPLRPAGPVVVNARSAIVGGQVGRHLVSRLSSRVVPGGRAWAATR